MVSCTLSIQKEMAAHSSILAWNIPWMGEHGRLQSLGLQRVGHDLATTHTHTLYPATLEDSKGVHKRLGDCENQGLGSRWIDQREPVPNLNIR